MERFEYAALLWNFGRGERPIQPAHKIRSVSESYRK